jgi:hypothetical protein
MILTRFALGARYSFWQFVGAGTSVAGLSVAILSDSDSPDVQGKYLGIRVSITIQGYIYATDHLFSRQVRQQNFLIQDDKKKTEYVWVDFLISGNIYRTNTNYNCNNKMSRN